MVLIKTNKTKEKATIPKSKKTKKKPLNFRSRALPQFISLNQTKIFLKKIFFLCSHLLPTRGVF